MRADAAGLPFDQVKAMSFSDQKLIKDAKGDPVGLTGDDYAKHAALTRGLKAMDVEVKCLRGAGPEKDARDHSRDQSPAKSAAQGKYPVLAHARAVSEDNWVDNHIVTLSVALHVQPLGPGTSPRATRRH